MNRKWLGTAALMLIAASLLDVSSCARSQELVSITIDPSTVTFLSPFTTLTFQLKAYGTFIHPPETKDLTNQVTWQTSAPLLSTVTSTGVVAVSGNGSCGVNQVTATYLTSSHSNGNIVIGTATVSVDGTFPGCP